MRSFKLLWDLFFSLIFPQNKLLPLPKKNLTSQYYCLENPTFCFDQKDSKWFVFICISVSCTTTVAHIKGKENVKTILNLVKHTLFTVSDSTQHMHVLFAVVLNRVRVGNVVQMRQTGVCTSSLSRRSFAICLFSLLPPFNRRSYCCHCAGKHTTGMSRSPRLLNLLNKHADADAVWANDLPSAVIQWH